MENQPLAERHAEQIEQLDKLARLLDTAVRIPGTPIEVGVDALVGLLPGAGDLLTGLVSAWIIVKARGVGASWTAVARMTLNLTLDVVVGSIPIAGDLFDVLWRTNRRNVDLLRRDLARRR